MAIRSRGTEPMRSRTSFPKHEALSELTVVTHPICPVFDGHVPLRDGRIDDPGRVRTVTSSRRVELGDSNPRLPACKGPPQRPLTSADVRNRGFAIAQSAPSTFGDGGGQVVDEQVDR